MHIKYMKYYIYHIPGVKIWQQLKICLAEPKKGNYVNLYGPNSWSIVST